MVTDIDYKAEAEKLFQIYMNTLSHFYAAKECAIIHVEQIQKLLDQRIILGEYNYFDKIKKELEKL